MSLDLANKQSKPTFEGAFRSSNLHKKSRFSSGSAAVLTLQKENAALRSELGRLSSLVYRDDATGLWNRRYLLERLDEEMSRAQRYQDRKLSILFIDINNLKLINDHYGHAAGDDAIQWVSNFLQSSFRQHDICCRWGGDEFVAVLPDLDAISCLNTINRLRSRLNQANQERDFPLQLSIGCVSYPDDGESIEDLIQLADSRMYFDKRRQKKKVPPNFSSEQKLSVSPLPSR